MSNFYVKPNKLKSSAGNIGQIQRAVKVAGSDVQSVINSLDKNQSVYANVARNLNANLQNLHKTENTLGKMKSGAQQIASLYESTERQISGNKAKAGAKPGSKTGAAKKASGKNHSIWDYLSKKYKERVAREKAILDRLAKTAKDTAAWWSDFYKKNKETLKKIAQTGKAVVSIGMSVCSILALWGLTAGSAGAGAPLATLGTIYAGDSIINNVRDIMDIWGGNPGHVGKNHTLQDALKNGGRELGKMIGNEKLGETIGNGFYYTGQGLTAFAEVKSFAGMAGQVKQAPDLAGELGKSIGEVKTGFGGMVDIVTKTPISQIKYQAKLLSYEIPHTMKVIESINVLKKVGGMTKTITESGVSFITDTLSCNSQALAMGGR